MNILKSKSTLKAYIRTLTALLNREIEQVQKEQAQTETVYCGQGTFVDQTRMELYFLQLTLEFWNQNSNLSPVGAQLFYTKLVE